MRTGPIIQFCTSDSVRIFEIAEDIAQIVVIHLRERRIHHEDKPHRYG